MKKWRLLILCCCVTRALLGFEPPAEDESSPWFAQLEIGPVWQSRNEVRIPSDSGSLVSIKDFSKGSSLSGRIYLGYHLSDKSELRVLFAPLTIQATANYPTFSFQGTTFAEFWPTTSLYRFNSYRVTYRYLFHSRNAWKLWVGFTGKIRDAEIAFSQRDFRQSKEDVGFVPLLHFRAKYQIGEKDFVDLDFDALAAPQGRAEDVSLKYWFPLGETVMANVGYRLLEGGADNDKVFTFAFLHYAVAAIEFTF